MIRFLFLVLTTRFGEGILLHRSRQGSTMVDQKGHGVMAGLCFGLRAFPKAPSLSPSGVLRIGTIIFTFHDCRYALDVQNRVLESAVWNMACLEGHVRGLPHQKTLKAGARGNRADRFQA